MEEGNTWCQGRAKQSRSFFLFVTERAPSRDASSGTGEKEREGENESTRQFVY